MDDESRQAINSVIAHRRVLMTHLRAQESFRDNNITERIIDEVEMKLKMILRFKKMNCAKNSLKMAIMHYRLSLFLKQKREQWEKAHSCSQASTQPTSTG